MGEKHERNRQKMPSCRKKHVHNARNEDILQLCVTLEKERKQGMLEKQKGTKKVDGNLSYDSDNVFVIGPGSDRPTVKVTINGVKGRTDADSCSTVNILDIDQCRILKKTRI